MLAFVRDHSAMRALSVLSTLAILAAACSPAEEVTRARLVLSLPASIDCQPPDGMGRLDIVASGDFPSTNDTVEVRSLTETMAMPIRKFPFETRVLTVALHVEDTFTAGALHIRAPSDAEASLLLLPLGASCAASDPEVYLPPGGALSPLPNGGYLVAGGLDEGSDAMAGFRRLVVVPPSEELANLDAELATRRIGASATLSGTRVVIAGGTEFEGQAAEETYEVYDARDGAVVPAVRPLCSSGVCQRRDHGAAALPDGRVLLVGGVSSIGAPPMSSVVAVDPQALTIDESFGPILTARRLPFTAGLDGLVVVAGGFAEDGALVRSVEAMDPSEGVFRMVASLPDRGDAAFVALRGRRLVMIGGRGDDEVAATVVTLGDRASASVATVDIRGLVALADARAATLADNRLLVVGTDDMGTRRAFRVDVGRGVAEERGEPSRPVAALVSCADGAVAEIGGVGGSYRRELLRSPFDNPPDPLVSTDAEWLSLDVATAYDQGSEVVTALDDGAAVRVAGLIFADVVISPTIEGPYRVVLENEAGVTRTVVVGDAAVNVDGCEVARTAGDMVALTRRETTLEIHTDAAVGQCLLADLEGHVRISLRLASGSRFRAVSVIRL